MLLLHLLGTSDQGILAVTKPCKILVFLGKRAIHLRMEVRNQLTLDHLDLCLATSLDAEKWHWEEHTCTKTPCNTIERNLLLLISNWKMHTFQMLCNPLLKISVGFANVLKS